MVRSLILTTVVANRLPEEYDTDHTKFRSYNERARGLKGVNKGLTFDNSAFPGALPNGNMVSHPNMIQNAVTSSPEYTKDLKKFFQMEDNGDTLDQEIMKTRIDDERRKNYLSMEKAWTSRRSQSVFK